MKRSDVIAFVSSFTINKTTEKDILEKIIEVYPSIEKIFMDKYPDFLLRNINSMIFGGALSLLNKDGYDLKEDLIEDLVRYYDEIEQTQLGKITIKKR